MYYLQNLLALRGILMTADADGKTNSTPGPTTRSRIGALVLGGLVGSV